MDIMIQLLKFSEIKKNPNIMILEKDHAAIVRYGNVVGFVVEPERMRQLIDAESDLKDLDTRLYTAYDCAISALNLTENEQVKVYLKEIIKCYLGDEK